MIADSRAEDIVPSEMDFGSAASEGSNAKPWRDICGSGHEIGAVRPVVLTTSLVAHLRDEYDAATPRIMGDLRGFIPAA